MAIPGGPTKLDVYALLDADSGEARTFTTYLGYWEALDGLTVTTHGNPCHSGILKDLRGRRAFHALRANQVKSHDEARGLLLNAWNSELALYMVDESDARLAAANQWNSVFSFYATGRAALAWMALRDGTAPSTHRALLNAMASQCAAGRLLPGPWNLACARLSPSVTQVNFPRLPVPSNPLAANVDPIDRLGMMLKTTRERRVRELVEGVKRRRRVARAPAGEFARQDLAVPTTVFDFLWRTRTRANYGDPSMFYMGTLTQDRSTRYVRTIRSFTSAGMFLFEALASQKAPEVVGEAAGHYISRDRTGITDQVLVPRLKVLGVL